VTVPLVADLGAAPELQFSVEGAEAVSRAAAPTIALRLGVERVGGGPVRSATVGVRVDIAPARRAYDATTRERLVDLFGAPDRWGDTLGSIGWSRATVLVGPFADRATAELALPCSYDFDVAAAKYLDALRDGDIPLDLMFSGMVLYDSDGRVQAAPIAWDREATYRLPVQVWRDAMAAAFGDSPWLRLRRDTFDRLSAYRARGAYTSWDAAIDSLLGEGPWTR
jgi:Family of unknown function (DUF6084)